MKPINIEQVKKQQIAQAKACGLPSPYSTEGAAVIHQAKLKGLPNPYSTMGAKLTEQAKAAGEPCPYHAGTPSTALTPGKTAQVLADFQMLLEVDMQKVKLESDIAEKIRVKRTLLPQYLDFVDGYVANNESYANDVAVEIFIWMLDVEDMQRALVLGLYLISQKQAMPERFTSDMRTFLCNAMTDWAATMLKAEQSAGPYLDTLVAIVEDEQWDVPMISLSKLFVQMAKHQERLGHYQEALRFCNKAEAINPEKAGVKGMKKTLSAMISAQEESA